MIRIAHRGNLHGPNPEKENTPSYIEAALRHFFCEIDLWFTDRCMLGHDQPTIPVEPNFLCNPKLFIHCKNIEALVFMSEMPATYFFHDKDPFVLTSKGHIWCYPNLKPIPHGINLLPEWNRLSKEDLQGCVGVCSDYIANY